MRRLLLRGRAGHLGGFSRGGCLDGGNGWGLLRGRHRCRCGGLLGCCGFWFFHQGDAGACCRCGVLIARHGRGRRCRDGACLHRPRAQRLGRAQLPVQCARQAQQRKQVQQQHQRSPTQQAACAWPTGQQCSVWRMGGRAHGVTMRWSRLWEGGKFERSGACCRTPAHSGRSPTQVCRQLPGKCAQCLGHRALPIGIQGGRRSQRHHTQSQVPVCIEHGRAQA